MSALQGFGLSLVNATSVFAVDNPASLLIQQARAEFQKGLDRTCRDQYQQLKNTFAKYAPSVRLGNYENFKDHCVKNIMQSRTEQPAPRQISTVGKVVYAGAIVLQVAVLVVVLAI